MKKYSIHFAIIFVIILIVGGVYYYYHNYVQVVTEYYRITYTPAQKISGSFGGYHYSNPKTEIDKLSFPSDSIAIEKENSEAKRSFKAYSSKFEEILRSPEPTDEIERITFSARVEAYKELLTMRYWLIISKHTRNFNAEDIFNFIKQKGFNKKELERYAENNKINVQIIPLHVF